METFLQIVIAIQSLGPAWENPMRFFSFLGTEQFFLFVLPVLYWNVNDALGLRVGLILLTSGALNSVFKMLFHRPRPYWISEQVIPMAAETSFGIPSGHAQISIGVWGMIAVWIRRLWVSLLLALLIFFIGLSRLYLGVHFPQDVLAGWLLGGLLLWGFVRLESPFLRLFRRLSFGQQLLFIWLISIFLIFSAIAVRAWNEVEISVQWVHLATRQGMEAPTPWSLGGVISPAAVLFGFAAGALWVQRAGGSVRPHTWRQHVLLYTLGLLGILILWMGLGSILPKGEDALALFFRYIRYALIGLWIGIVPYGFKRWGRRSLNTPDIIHAAQ